MPWSAVASIGGSLISGAMASDASEDAANAQSQSSANSIAEQRRQYDLNRADQAQYMQTGNAANKKLAYLLGLGADDGGGDGSKYTLDDFKGYNQRAAPEWYGTEGQNNDSNIQYQRYLNGEYDDQALVDRFGLRKLTPATPGSNSANGYGSLLKKFDANDLANDAVYNSGLQFGLDQGTGAINARALAGGSYDSGATLKALTRYANDYGSTKANESYNRYNTSNDAIYNKLAGVSGAGQTATNQVGSQGTSMAQNIGASMEGAGNARAAGIVGGSNAWGNAIGGISNAANNYGTSQWLKGLSSGSGSNSGWDGSDWSTSGYGVDGGYSDM